MPRGLGILRRQVLSHFLEVSTQCEGWAARRSQQTPSPETASSATLSYTGLGVYLRFPGNPGERQVPPRGDFMVAEGKWRKADTSKGHDTGNIHQTCGLRLLAQTGLVAGGGMVVPGSPWQPCGTVPPQSNSR